MASNKKGNFYERKSKNPQKMKRREINRGMKTLDRAMDNHYSDQKARHYGKEYERRFRDRKGGVPDRDVWYQKKRNMERKLDEQKKKTSRVKRVKSRIPGKPPGGWNKFKTRGSVTASGLRNLLGPAIAVEAGTQAIKNVSAMAKKKQTTSQRKAIGQQDKRMMKKYKKKDPKRQAVFKKLMSKKTKIKEY